MSRALPAGPVARRRAFFGALDADGWTWAGLKAFFWLIVIILLLGYIPDRAYYFTVNRTIDLGIMVWSPVNLCPAENGGLPCPAPVGALEPWQTSPAQLSLPEGRTNGSAASLGSNLLYVGGSNGTAPTKTMFLAKVANGNFSAWSPGPDLPEARQGTGIAVLNGAAYLIGGTGSDGQPTNSVFVLKSDPTSGSLGTWGPLADATAPASAPASITLPEARTGAAVLAVSDGILVAGGTGPDGKPSTKVWKSSTDSKGNLGQFVAQPDLPDGVTGANIVLSGTFVWVYGGTDANGPSGAVQRASFGQPTAGGGTTASPAASGAVTNPAPAASAAPVPDQVLQWGTSNAVNVAPRANAAGFSANGAIYLVGGSDGSSARPEVYWAVPDATGNLPGGWSHLPVMDLPAGVQGGQAVAAGSGVFIIGGQSDGGIVKGALRASTAPQEPFFQLGIAGAVVPALQIPGEIGQQLGYLSAAGAGTLDFIILAVIGWAYAHRPTISAWWQRRRSRRAA